MSAVERTEGELEPRSKIKVIRNAKGDPQWEISVAEGSTPEELDRIRGIAVAQHLALVRELA